MKRKKRLFHNTLSSLVFQITTIICGFILPRFVLQSFGSEVNGLVNSITQFLSIISFLELGVGAVVQSSLYRPLADKDNDTVSRIIVSASRFFRRLAQLLLVYITVLMVIYPYIAVQNFSWIYTASLIAAMSISFFAQYYFGVVDRLLLTADQRGFIQYNTQTFTLILNTVACVLLIKAGASIHIVKLTTSLIYLLRPLFLRVYVNRHYSIDRKIVYSEEPIIQKWNGVAQHIAAVILDSTDSIVLTIFSTLSNVSIYSIYNLVVYGVKSLFLSMTNGMQALIGELWAKQEINELRVMFGQFEWLIHTGTVLVFGCTGVLIIPFVQVYTKGITDANYIQPIFAILLVTAHAVHCLRLPYNMMILAGGHYKQTQNNYIVAAILNIMLSIISVKTLGLIGVAIGTLIAMLYQTIWMAIYCSRNLLQRPIKKSIKQVFVDMISVVVLCASTWMFKLTDVNFISWVLLAIKVAGIGLVAVLAINSIFYKPYVNLIFKGIVNIMKFSFKRAKH